MEKKNYDLPRDISFLIFNFVDLSFAILVVKNRATHLFESFSNSRLFKLFNFSIIGQ